MAKKIDWKKSYGTVYGVTDIRYEQDGRGYDGAGYMIRPLPEDVEEVPTEEVVEEIVDADFEESEPNVPEASEQPGADGSLPENKPLEEVTMKQLRARYGAVTGGKKIPVGTSKGDMQAMIKAAL